MPLLIAMYWLAIGSNDLLAICLWALGLVVAAAYYSCGYGIAKWVVGLFAVLYCGFQSYVFFSLLGSGSTALIYFLSFAIMTVNGLVLLFSKTVANSFALSKGALSDTSVKRLKLLFWLLVAVLAGLLIKDVIRL